VPFAQNVYLLFLPDLFPTIQGHPSYKVVFPTPLASGLAMKIAAANEMLVK
jgi:hypothetical protein